MKILMLSSFYSPVRGGITTCLESLSRGLIDKGNNVSICTILQRGLPEIEEDNGLRIIRIEGFYQKIPFLFKDAVRKWHPPAQDWLITKKIADIIRRIQPDIIHTHCWLLYSILPQKNEFKIPLVHHLHDYGLFCPKMLWLRKNAACNDPSIRNCLSCLSSNYGLLRSLLAYYGVKLNKDKLKYVDKFIAPSDYIRKAYENNLGIITKNIIKIPNFLPPYTENNQKYEGDIPSDFILYVGLLMPHKGINVLLEAYSKLNTSIKLVIAGIEHPDYHYQSGGNIVVLKNLSHKAVMSIISKCRFIVIPSLWPETFSMVALEAMSLGKAIIAYKSGGLTEMIVDGETGVLVSSTVPYKLAEAISGLLQKPDETSRMGQNAYNRFMDNYTSSRVIPQFINLYESLV